MSPFLSLTRTRSFCLLHPLFRVYTENQPHRHLVAICQLQNYLRDLSRIAFRTPLEASQYLEHRADRGLVVRQKLRRILTRAPCPVGPDASRLQCADLDPERRDFHRQSVAETAHGPLGRVIRRVAGNTPYHAAKWAVGGFSDALAMEVAPFGVKICTLEPGGIRTNWTRRAGQNAPELLPDYEASVGSMLKVLRGLEGRAEGDPRKIAEVILQLANSDEVPVRLILGVGGEKRMQQAEAARASEAEKWRHLTVSTVFEDGRFDSRLYMANSGIDS